MGFDLALVRFQCVDECAQCCIEREYYPTKRFGKIGVLILPEETERISKLADQKGISITILPRIGISDKTHTPEKILAYQLMGIEENGNTCPFLDTDAKSPHGGHSCKIYDERPLACRAYPLIESAPLTLDAKCKFCKECGNADENLEGELESLVKIKGIMATDAPHVWRYATGVCESKDRNLVQTGWIPESTG